MKCRECSDLVDEKGAHKCKHTGAQIAENRLDVNRPCVHRKHAERRERLQVVGPKATTKADAKEAVVEEVLTSTLCPVAENPECVDQKPVPEPDVAPEYAIESVMAYLTAMKREAEAADAVVQAAHRVYGIGPETAEIARVVRQITECRLAQIKEAS